MTTLYIQTDGRVLDRESDYVSDLMAGFTERAKSQLKEYNDHIKKSSTVAPLDYLVNCYAQTHNLVTRKQLSVKIAAAMGNASDKEIEGAIQMMAMTYLQDKAPKLMEYYVGCQLLDKTEDNLRGVAILSFKVGKTWVYVPAFFLRGEIKGLDMGYNWNKDEFFPLKETHINEILFQTPDRSFGSIDDESSYNYITRPMVDRIVSPYKTGHYFNLPEWLRQGLVSFGKLATQELESAEIDLVKLASTNKDVFIRLANVAYLYPSMKMAFDYFYGKDFFDNAYDSIVEIEKQRHGIENKLRKYRESQKYASDRQNRLNSRKKAKVTFITADDEAYFPYLSTKQASDVLEKIGRAHV
jgi:hypothetical protein